MKGKLLNTKDSVLGIAKCCNGNLGIVIKMTPSQNDMINLKSYGLAGIQYKVIPFEMELTIKSQEKDFEDSNGNTWEVLDCYCD